MRALYSLLVWLAQPLLRRKLRRRALAEPGYAEAVEERFGYYSRPPSAGWVWVHAVSLGETRAAAAFIAALRQQLPGMQLLLTHGTATGRAQGQELLQPGDAQVWLPWDTRGATRRFLAHWRPRIGLLMETEVWPNLVAACAAQEVPLCLVNARLSAKSLRQALRLRSLAQGAYGGLHAVWAQSESDAQRLRQLGAPVRGAMGNFKFDANPDMAQWQRGRDWRQHSGKPVLLLASAREGEEQMLLEILERNRAQSRVDTGVSAINNGVQYLLVPRHPQRFDAVAALCQAFGFSVTRRSQWTTAPQPADIWLGDSLGEMALYYGLADAALLGGSFAPLGGQNLIEAAACACPVFAGPHTFNFAEAVALAQQAGALVVTSDLAQAMQAAAALLASEQLPARRQAAQDWAAQHRGAAARTAAAVRELLRLRT